jgi:hypothetical protein
MEVVMKNVTRHTPAAGKDLGFGWGGQPCVENVLVGLHPVLFSHWVAFGWTEMHCIQFVFPFERTTCLNLVGVVGRTVLSPVRIFFWG